MEEFIMKKFSFMNIVKTSYELAKDGKNNALDTAEFKKTINGIDIYDLNVEVNPQAPIACAAPVFTILGTKNSVFVDKTFYQMKDEVGEKFSDFIINHEIGHIRLGHVNEAMSDFRKYGKNKRSLTKEIQADLYALINTDLTKKDVIDVLQLMKSCYPWYEIKGKKEINKRIIAIREFQGL